MSAHVRLRNFLVQCLDVSSQKPQPNTRLSFHIQRRRQHLEFTQPPVFHDPTPVLEHDEGVFRGRALPLVYAATLSKNACHAGDRPSGILNNCMTCSGMALVQACANELGRLARRDLGCIGP
jgi:hypothetical protein